jgi:hypothetical protein
MERELGGSHIILSTLSMISNPSLHDNGTFDIIPVERLIIDEASQINIFEFIVSDYFSSSRLHFLSILFCCSTYSFGFNQYFRKFVSSATPSNVSSSAFFLYQELFKRIEVPPFGQDKVASIKTIFDLTSRPNPDFFLNIQCLLISVYSYPSISDVVVCLQTGCRCRLVTSSQAMSMTGDYILSTRSAIHRLLPS